MSKNWRISLVAVSVVIVLSACTPTVTAPSPSPKPTETVEPSPSPSPSETRTAKPTLGEIIATPNGLADSLGPMLVTVTEPIVAGDPALAIVEWDDTVCDETEAGPETGGWKPAYPLTSDGKYPFFTNMAARATDSPVKWISIQSEEIRTAEGLGMGSTVAELEAEYGADLVEGTSFDYTSHTLKGTEGQLVFWSQLDGIVLTLDVLAASEPVEFYYTTTPCA